MRVAFLLLFLFLPYTAVSAEEPKTNFYLVGALGATSVSIDSATNDADLRSFGFTNVRSTVSDTSTMFRVGAGVLASDYVSFELAYADFGSYSYNATFTQGRADATMSITGVGISGVGKVPITESVSFFGRVGLYHADLNIKSSVTITGAGSGSSSTSASSTSPWFGVGFEFRLSPQAALRVEFERVQSVGDQSTGESDIKIFGAGILWQI